MRHPLGDLDPFALQRRDLARIVGEKSDLLDPKLAKDCCCVSIVAFIVGEAQAQVRIARVEAAVL